MTEVPVSRTKVYPNSAILLLSYNRMRKGKKVIFKMEGTGYEVVGVDSCMIGDYRRWSNIIWTRAG
ncbi:hypothetical protein D3C73_1149320 [compost metagenome]